MKKVHLMDRRLRNNAGMDFPLCYADAPLLDVIKSYLETTWRLDSVTCKRCLAIVKSRNLA